MNQESRSVSSQNSVDEKEETNNANTTTGETSIFDEDMNMSIHIDMKTNFKETGKKLRKKKQKFKKKTNEKIRKIWFK